jgi:hypothetical protein
MRPATASPGPPLPFGNRRSTISASRGVTAVPQVDTLGVQCKPVAWKLKTACSCQLPRVLGRGGFKTVTWKLKIACPCQLSTCLWVCLWGGA